MQSRKNLQFRKKTLTLTALSGVVVLGVAACSTPGSSAAGTESAKSGEITVVASTSAYGSLVKAIGAAKGKALVDFLWWAIHDGQATTTELNYAPLPREVVTKIETTLTTDITSGGQPLLKP